MNRIRSKITHSMFLWAMLLILVVSPSRGQDPMVRPYRPPLPAIGTPVTYEDLDDDGDPDVLRTTTVQGMPLQWIDDDDDMTAGDISGDIDSDCLMVDRNRDGDYGGPHDLIVDWNDEDGDGRADMQVIADNGGLDRTAWDPGHYMIVLDTDGDGVFNYIDWRDFKLKCWEHSGPSHFFEDYLGTSMFMKMHTTTANIVDVRYNWENPFLFYDDDGDGVSERAIRFCDTPRIRKEPHGHFRLPRDSSGITEDMRRVQFTKRIDWVSIAQDLDNDSAPGNEFDFDMTLHFQGKGFDYSDQVHHFKSMRGLPEADRFFYDARWRRNDELIYADHDAAYDLVFQRGQWDHCWLVYDEDDDCQRWERVELYQPRDPFTIGKGKDGIDHHYQSDVSGDRGEWDQDNSGFGKLYVGGFDGRVHLYGAESGAWRIDQDAQFFQGWSRSRNQPERYPTIFYSDTDGNGFFDRIEYDLDGDQKFERAVSLLSLGLDDTRELHDPAGMRYADFQALHRSVAEGLWQRAQDARRVAIANGLDIAAYANMMHPGSLREKYHYGYWLCHYIYNDLAAMAERRGDPAFMAALDKAHYGGDWEHLTRKLASPSAAPVPGFVVKVSNPLALRRKNATVALPWSLISEKLPAAKADRVRVIDLQTGREIVSQVVDQQGDGRDDSLLFQADFAPNQELAFRIQAAPRVACVHDPSPVHAKFVPTRMDDFAWESDRIAFRVYGPALRVETISNGIDVWAKRVRYPIVEKWYQPGVNYHTDTGEGGDLFKVGETLGCGGTGIWLNGKLYRGENFDSYRIIANGPIRAIFELTFRPQTIGSYRLRETKRFSIDAGHNLTRLETVYDGSGPTDAITFAVGLVKRPGTVSALGAEQPWISLWGSLDHEHDGQLGTGAVMTSDTFVRSIETDDHVLMIGRARLGEPAVHWAGAGWSRSRDFASAEAWNEYLAEWSRRVNVPLEVTVGDQTFTTTAAATSIEAAPVRPPTTTAVAKGWARNSINAVSFRQHALTTHDDTQYIAFYDQSGRMVLGRRELPRGQWQIRPTDHRGNVRDAHNAISIAVDGDGYLHVAWNHHGSALHYAKGKRPGALALSGPTAMTGRDEGSVTYPEFYNLPGGDLLFMYRAGGSGRGNTMLNRYDASSGKWSIVQHPLIDGEGQRNAYTNQLAIDRQGGWHLSWCWRESGDVASNHDICYARSTDQGRTWTRSDGTAYKLPITSRTAEIACAVPQNHELINQCATAVDSKGQPMIATYWRPDRSQVPQYHLVWHDGSAWQVSQIGRRRSPFTLSGGGTRRIPISRPKLAVDDEDRVFLLFRDAERGQRVSVAVSSDPARKHWRLADLTESSVGQWEPAYDTELWRQKGLLHVFTQRVGQGEGETLDDMPAQQLSVLEWGPDFSLNPAPMMAATRAGGVPIDHWAFDFGSGPVEKRYIGVRETAGYTAQKQYGWIVAPQHVRHRGLPDKLRGDHVFSRAPARFRVNVPPGIYRITLVVGDRDYGDHVTQITIPGVLPEAQILDPAKSEFVTLQVAAHVAGGVLEFQFDSPVDNWVVNVLTIEPADKAMPPEITREPFKPTAASLNAWEDVFARPDPIAPYVAEFRRQLAAHPKIEPTGLHREDYLTVAAGIVDFFKEQQNADGAIIDPVDGHEIQYSTPCFALAAATLAVHAGRDDLLEPAAKALDWAVRTLSERRAASSHEDFFPPHVAEAIMLLESRVSPERVAHWKSQLHSYDPFETYRAAPGGVNWNGGENWNIIALSGEGLFYNMGIRENMDYVETSLAAQGRWFNSPWGMYTEGPMVYDLFPRAYVANLLATGITCKNSDQLTEVLRRGALTSLFLESPTGELPVGGRSAHHQWNEAEECMLFEIYAARAAERGDREMAGVYKRAAHLALHSVNRWVRPSGELWVLKNHNAPAAKHGYERYTSHSQYNLLAASMLCLAYKHCSATANVAERPCPADLGGFVLHLEEPFNKVIANAGGLQIVVDYDAELPYNPTGLLRVHKHGVNPQIGPSDGLTARAAYKLPGRSRTTAAVGIAWQGISGEWHRLAEFGRRHAREREEPGGLKAKLSDVQQSPKRVSFTLTYRGEFDGPTAIIERYELTPDMVVLTTELVGFDGPRRMVWPVLCNDGANPIDVVRSNKRIIVSTDEGSEIFSVDGATSVTLGEQKFPCRNGWARVARAAFDPSKPVTLTITPLPVGR